MTNEQLFFIQILRDFINRAKKTELTLTAQSHHPYGNTNLIAAMRLISKLSTVNMYRLRCNMEDEAALVAYHGMVKE